MKNYDIESIVIATVLTYGIDPARTVLPQLTPDKFIFRCDGEFGSDHSIIWQGISETFFDHRPPTLTEVSTTLKGAYYSEMRALVDRLENQYKIHSYEAVTFQNLASLVDKAGIVYNMATSCAELHECVNDVQVFMQTVNEIDDIDQWTSQQLDKFRKINTMKTGGYVSSAKIVETVVERWEKAFKGEELVLPDCGIPILKKNALFPRGKLSVLHGMSGSGKSSLAFQYSLGVAIDLFLNDKQGCVAINSLEMGQEDLIERMAAILARIDVSKFLKGTISREEVDKLIEWSKFISALPLFIDDTNFMTTSAMQYRAQGLHVSEHGPVIQLTSDYNELFADENSSEEQRVGHIMREQFRLSRMINAAVLAISQSTINREFAKRTYIAGPDGTRYSKAILHATDILVELWNPVSLARAGRHDIQVPDKREFCLDYPHLFIQKARGSAEGGEISLGWIPESTTFYDQDVNFGMNQGKEVIFTHLEKAVAKWKNNESAW